MKNNHTKGPWHVNSVVNTEVNSFSGEAIAECHMSAMIKYKQQVANAHLIAAAPEMLEALEKVEKHHQGAHSEIGAIIRSAIAKAKGNK